MRRTPWGHRLNYRRDLPGQSKTPLYEARIDRADYLPALVDGRDFAPPVVDQGSLGSCTGNALAYHLGDIELRAIRKAQADPAFTFGSFQPLSRLFIYWHERAIEGDTSQDAGATLTDGLTGLMDKGVCREATWPYLERNVFECPPQGAFSEACGHKVSQSQRLDNTNLLELKSCLNDGNSFVFGISVFASFFETGADGMVPEPAGQFQGGHALCCFGYDDKKQAFIVRNSWGTSWGDKGDCYIPYEYLTDPDLAADFLVALK